jgi:predicted  nucleic acid-binding Zn-ribbon protein
MLSSCGSRYATVQKRILSGFSAIKDDVLMRDFLSETLDTVGCGADKHCDATWVESRRELGSIFTLLYLRALMLTKSEESGSLGTLSLEILDKSQQLASRRFKCTVKSSTPKISNLQLIEECCTPENKTERHSWKDQLSAYAQMETKCREDSLIRLVGSICSDLEQRCLTAEEPFRKEEARSQKLQQHIEELQEQKNRLQGQLVERDMILESLETDKNDTEDSLKEAQVEKEQLLARIGAAERKLQDVTNASREHIDTLKTEYDTRELNLRAALADKVSTVEDQQIMLAASKDKITALHSDVESAKSCASKLQEQIQPLEVHLQQCRQDLAIEQKARTEADIKIQSIENDKEDVMCELNNMLQKHQESVSQFNAQRSKCEEQIVSLKGDIESLRSCHAATIEQISDKMAIQTASLTTQLSDALAYLNDAKQEVLKLRQETEDNRTAISDQQQEIKQLEGIVAQKEEEISEFQTMRDTLAAAIGTKVPDRKHMSKSVHHTYASESTSRAPRHPSRRALAEPKEVQPCEDIEDEMSDKGGRSFDSACSNNGPTPKRAKPRKAFKLPTIRQPRISIAVAKSAKFEDKRLPLVDVAGRANISPARPMKSHNSGYEKQVYDDDNARDLEEAIDLEFGSDFMFTSTPFTPKPSKSMAETGFYDDTTVDE